MNSLKLQKHPQVFLLIASHIISICFDMLVTPQGGTKREMFHFFVKIQKTVSIEMPKKHLLAKVAKGKPVTFLLLLSIRTEIPGDENQISETHFVHLAKFIYDV